MELAAIIISGISLLIAIISFAFSLSAQHLQNKVNQLEIKLKQYEIAEKEKEGQRVSCVEARIIHVIKTNYKIKVWNSGNVAVKNVTASIDNSAQLILIDRDKMPYEILEPQKSFELRISTYDASPSKIYIVTEWEDEEGNKQTKKQLCDL